MSISPHRIFLIKGNYLRAGGPETLIGSIVRYLDREKFSPSLVLLRKLGAPDSLILTDNHLSGLRQEIVWRGIVMSPLTAQEIGRLSNKQEAVLLHTHDMRSNLVAYLLTRVRRIPWIAHIHGWLGATHTGRWYVYERIDQWLVRYADLVLVGSQTALQEVRTLGVRQARVIPNAVEIPALDTFQAEGQRIRRELEASDSSVVVGVVGRLHPGKGQAFLIRALAQLRKKGVDVRGVIVGEGPDFENLQALSRDLGLGGYVTLTGFCLETTPYMAAMDIVVVPSLKESLPLTALEAMSLQKPVIASRVGDLPKIITHGVNGLLVQPGDVSDLSATLEALILDAVLRQRLGERARELAIARFSSEAMARTLETIYADVIAGRKAVCASPN
jgi:glycosyltransferase involved in cell wall biosynthesis